MTPEPRKPTPLPMKYRVGATLGAVLGMATGIGVYKLMGIEKSGLFGVFLILGGSLGIILAPRVVRMIRPD